MNCISRIIFQKNIFFWSILSQKTYMKTVYKNLAWMKRNDKTFWFSAVNNFCKILKQTLQSFFGKFSINTQKCHYVKNVKIVTMGHSCKKLPKIIMLANFARISYLNTEFHIFLKHRKKLLKRSLVLISLWFFRVTLMDLLQSIFSTVYLLDTSDGILIKLLCLRSSKSTW